MSEAPNQILSQTINNIFANNQAALLHHLSLKGTKGKNAPSKRSLELAMAVLLVDLAGCDENFEQREYQVIVSGLQRMFGTSRSEVSALVNQATLELANLRGPSRFAELLKENLNLQERQRIMQIVEEIIMADAKEDSFEIYLRNKLANLLDLESTIIS